MNILIHCNRNQEEAGRRLAERFASLGINCGTDPDAADYDLMCVLGGDGSILDAASTALRLDLPIFGINTGRVGFLAAFDRDAVDRITLEDIEALYESRRSTLICEVDGIRDVCVNEAGIFKKDIGRTVELEVFSNENSLGTYTCDGILISTPTGSTAYNLSAGGPVLHPELPCCVVTPICAYNSAHRSMVLPVDGTVKVVMSGREQSAVVTADGREVAPLGAGGTALIRRIPVVLRLMLPRTRKTYAIISGNH